MKRKWNRRTKRIFKTCWECTAYCAYKAKANITAGYAWNSLKKRQNNDHEKSPPVRLLPCPAACSYVPLYLETCTYPLAFSAAHLHKGLTPPPSIWNLFMLPLTTRWSLHTPPEVCTHSCRLVQPVYFDSFLLKTSLIPYLFLPPTNSSQSIPYSYSTNIPFTPTDLYTLTITPFLPKGYTLSFREACT